MNEEYIRLFEEMESRLRTLWFKYHHFIVPQDTDLSPVQLFLLKFIKQRQGSTPSAIAKGFGITLGAVTGLVDRMYKLDLVCRTRSEEDRRVVLIHLTPKGFEVLEQFEQQRQEKFSLMEEKIKQPEVQSLTLLMENLETVLDELKEKERGK